MKKKLYPFIAALCIFVLTFECSGEDSYIKWVDFSLTNEAMKDAVAADIDSLGDEIHFEYIELLSCLSVKYGGNFKLYKKSDIEDIKAKRSEGLEYSEIANNDKLYSYYKEAYNAAIGGMVGYYREYTVDSGVTTSEDKYGVRLASPIASGYYYSHFDDFGASRSYGYRRNHLGHDLMGSVGTPVIAVEAGYVEACGWNQYGGWRIGIRSFDSKRYYYYAHLRKDKPYEDIYEGKIVGAGEVIGYLGMTGYSAKENVNNINVPHLHWGLELIFDPSQKDGYNQIWLDMYSLTNFLEDYKSGIQKNSDGAAYSTKYKIPVEAWD